MAHFKAGGVDGGDDYTPPPVSWRMLKFLDDTQSSVFGLDEILADFYAEGRNANDETAQEIITRLEVMKNYIPSSDRARGGKQSDIEPSVKEFHAKIGELTTQNDFLSQWSRSCAGPAKGSIGKLNYPLPRSEAADEKNTGNSRLWPSLIKLVNVNLLTLTYLMRPARY